MKNILIKICLLITVNLYSQNPNKYYVNRANNIYIPYNSVDGSYEILLYNFIKWNTDSLPLTVKGQYLNNLPTGNWKVYDSNNILLYETYYRKGIIFRYIITYENEKQNKIKIRVNKRKLKKYSISGFSLDGCYEVVGSNKYLSVFYICIVK